jgi:glutaredoxin
MSRSSQETTMTTQTSVPAGAADDEIRVYWQTGCTACLRTKEFLARHGIPFISRNVLVDDEAFAELARFAIRQVPIVTRGDQWANGQVLADVARVAGIPLGTQHILAVAELEQRLQLILTAAQRYAGQLPDACLDQLLPNRPRSYATLVFHIFNIPDCFLEHHEGIGLTYEAYSRTPPPGMTSKSDLVAYGADVQSRLGHWFRGPGKSADWNARADVYYGEQTLHQFLERTTWHCAQHTRQLMYLLETQHGISPERPLGNEVFAGLPMPVQVWDGMEAA